MKKSHIFFIIGLILIGIGFGFYFYKAKNAKTSDNINSGNFTFSGTRVSANNELNGSSSNSSSESSDTQKTKNENSSSTANSTNETETPEQVESPSEADLPKEETETQIAEFSTKIYTKDSERQNNISITCSTLNDIYVNNGETFSFCNTVGKATTDKGYQKADVYQDGEVIQALGGGNCQVSTTLYNAVLQVEGLSVTERHEHSNSVPYIAKGKDAAVAYGSYDFKFINNTGNKIKISASNDNSFVYIKIFKVS